MVRYERLPNYGTTNLDGAINDSVTSITVDDGSVWPGEGDYRILIGTEVLLVTARSTNTLTVERGVDGTTAASHSDGAQVQSVATADEWNRLMIDLGTGMRSDDTLTTGIEWPRNIQDHNGNILTASDFTQVGFQTSTTLTDTAYNGLRLFDTNGGGNTSDNRLVVVSAPSAPFTVTCKFFFGYGATYNSWDWFFLCARESSTGEYYAFRHTPWNGMPVQHNNSTTSVSATVNNDPDPSAVHMWFRIVDDGTDIKFQHSTDGYRWKQNVEEGSTSRLAGGADQVGFGINAEASGGNDFPVYVTSFIIEDTAS